jgi:hypothetical protein
MFNIIKHHIEDRVKMAIAEEIVKIFRPNRQEDGDKKYTIEEKEKLEEMRKIKGDVKVLSPDHKQPSKRTEDTTAS